ncbi:nucleotidyltransferase domain-containing protein [Sphingomonas sp. PP-CC-3A-396]|uniref:nucleotidyltransferase domain-containing protein n=1 Tax=Sphingomonas sp. PP-CC-3A-396 TaxID=2135655 RepID=UPI001044BBB5|nr:nucleotidyltransferase domain-containing protein [Sphingomonas sp. PP-CC-3A-396]TCQ05736.1 hypothetical protein C8J40_106259 [Sphingomonas sp. PP-CC-3A-396]
MADSLILYGSRARGDSRAGSDVDLISASDGQGIVSPVELNGISVHRYSKGWLEQQACEGSLFAYHVAFEGIGLLDPDSFLCRLKAAYRPKHSYRDDARIAALILRFFMERDWNKSDEAKRRLFWAIRTILICASADAGTPLFSSRALEQFADLDGLSSLIDRRSLASLAEVNAMGTRVLDMFQPALDDINGERLAKYLAETGGIARDSVRILGEIEAIELIGLSIYM